VGALHPEATATEKTQYREAEKSVGRAWDAPVALRVVESSRLVACCFCCRVAPVQRVHGVGGRLFVSAGHKRVRFDRTECAGPANFSSRLAGSRKRIFGVTMLRRLGPAALSARNARTHQRGARSYRAPMALGEPTQKCAGAHSNGPGRPDTSRAR
jgi:hypothetical protein